MGTMQLSKPLGTRTQTSIPPCRVNRSRVLTSGGIFRTKSWVKTQVGKIGEEKGQRAMVWLRSWSRYCMHVVAESGRLYGVQVVRSHDSLELSELTAVGPLDGCVEYKRVLWLYRETAMCTWGVIIG